MKRMWYQKGSYTVEAAFIVPVLLGIAFMLMYLILLFHDQMLLQGKFNDTIFCILEKTTSSEEISKQDFNKNLLVVQVEHVRFSTSLGTLQGEVSANAVWDIPVLKIFMQHMQKIQIKGKCRMEHPDHVKRYLNQGKESIPKKDGTD